MGVACERLSLRARYSYFKWRILTFMGQNWKCHVIVIKTDVSGFVVTMHSGLCEQYVKSLRPTPLGFDFLFSTRPCALWQQAPPKPVLIPQVNHCGPGRHIVSDILSNIGSGNGLAPVWLVFLNNAGLLLMEPLGIIFNLILIKIQIFSFKKMHWKYFQQTVSHFIEASISYKQPSMMDVFLKLNFLQQVGLEMGGFRCRDTAGVTDCWELSDTIQCAAVIALSIFSQIFT